MTTITYFGISPESIGLINSEEFLSVLKAHPELRIVTLDEDDDDNPVVNDVILPLPEGYRERIGIIDKNNGHKFMWVLYDDCDSIANPSPAFMAVLKVMDKYSSRTLKQRLFIPNSGEQGVHEQTMLTAAFDFTTGNYIPLTNYFS